MTEIQLDPNVALKESSRILILKTILPAVLMLVGEATICLGIYMVGGTLPCGIAMIVFGLLTLGAGVSNTGTNEVTATTLPPGTQGSHKPPGES